MSYIELMNNFWSMDEIQPFSCSETRLYMYLLNTANRMGWPEVWTCSDVAVASSVGVSTNTMKKAREVLVERGLIVCRQGGLGQHSKTAYIIVTGEPDQELGVSLGSSLGVNLGVRLGSRLGVRLGVKNCHLLNDINIINNISKTKTKTKTNKTPIAPAEAGERPSQEKAVNEDPVPDRQEAVTDHAETAGQEEKKASTKKDRPEKIDFEALATLFNRMFDGKLSHIMQMTEKRKAAVRARIAVHGKESVLRVFDTVLRSPFLLGDNDRSWRADFDWIFKPSNFVKILEGNYLKHNDYGENGIGQKTGSYRQNEGRASPGTDAENKRRERQHLGELADAILQQSASQNT